MSERQKLKGSTGFEEQATVGVSPWMLSVLDELGTEKKSPHWSYSLDDFSFELVEGIQSLWILTRFPVGGEIAFRAAYCPDGRLQIDDIQQTDSASRWNSRAQIARCCIARQRSIRSLPC